MAGTVRPYLYACTLWAIAVTVHAVFYVTTVLAGPPSSDLYANNAGFQVAMFAFFRLPLWLVALVIVLVAMSTVRAKRRKEQ